MTPKVWIWQDEYNTDMGLQFDIAATGFRLRGADVIRYRDISEVALNKGDVLYGVASDIHALGVPQIPDYPDALEEWSLPHRRSTLREVKEELDFPFFIKPVNHKEFSGLVAKRPASLGFIDGNPEVWVADMVKFRSEWRVYVHHGDIKKICHYKGDPLCFPKDSAIKSMIDQWGDAPVAFALDVGVLEIPSLLQLPDDRTAKWKGDTCLVEVNDLFCLGNYGVDSADFAQMLESRWQQIWNSDWSPK